MADPLSIAGTAVSLVATIARVVKDVEQFVRQIREARADMDGISRELWSLKAVLEMLTDDVKSGATVPPKLEDILKNCAEVMGRLDATLQQYNSERLRVRVKYVWSGKEMITHYRDSLAAHKGALDLAVDLVTLSMTREIKKDTDAILEDTGGIKLDVENILAKIRRLQAQLPPAAQATSDKTDFILRRYLDDVTSQAGSFVEDSHDWTTSNDAIQETAGGRDNPLMLPESHADGARERVRPEGSTVRSGPQQAEWANQGSKTPPSNSETPLEMSAFPSSISLTSMNQAERRSEGSEIAPPNPETPLDTPAVSPSTDLSSLNQAKSQVRPREVDGFIWREEFEHIGLKAAGDWKRNEFVGNFMNVPDSLVAPRDGRAYRIKVDYVLDKSRIRPILPAGYNNYRPAAVKWARQFTMSGGDVNKPFCLDKSTRTYAIIAALAVRDSEWFHYLLMAGANVDVYGYEPWEHPPFLANQIGRGGSKVLLGTLYWDMSATRKVVQASAKPTPGLNAALELIVTKGSETVSPLKTGKAADYLIYVAKYLLANGAEVNPPNRSPLHSCIGSVGSTSMVRFLLDNGADANRVYPSLGTPLHTAVQASRFGIVKILVDAGAKLSVVAKVVCPFQLLPSNTYYFEKSVTPIELAARLGTLEQLNQALGSVSRAELLEVAGTSNRTKNLVVKAKNSEKAVQGRG